MDEAVRFWIADTGNGIPSAQLSHLFDRFWQGGRADRQGVGLGLPIVKGIVEAHGGCIWVESAPGRGTTFFLTIPTKASYPKRALNESAPPVKPRGPDVRILIVDDDAESLAALRGFLQSAGFTLETARDGADALLRLGSFVPDILITDVQMSGLDGIALAAQVRQLHPDISIILMTWLDQNEEAIMAGLEKKRTYYVAKPVEIEGFFLPSTARLSVQVSEAQVRWDKERVESDRLKQENLQIESRYQDLQRQLAAARSEAPTQAVSPPRSALRPPDSLRRTSRRPLPVC